MKLDRHFSPGREVEEVVRKETVVFRDREINCLRKLVTRQFHAKTAARLCYLGSDRRLRERQLLERRKEVVVSRNCFSIHEQLAIHDDVPFVGSVEQVRDSHIEIRTTRQRSYRHITYETLQRRAIE